MINNKINLYYPFDVTKYLNIIQHLENKIKSLYVRISQSEISVIHKNDINNFLLTVIFLYRK